jgi:hypothetical protein
MWDIMSNICGKQSCFVYIKPALRTRNGRDAYMLLFDHFLGPYNVGNMASAADTKLTDTLYNGKKKRFTWVLIPQVRPARKYSISPWEMIHLPGEITQ